MRNGIILYGIILILLSSFVLGAALDYTASNNAESECTQFGGYFLTDMYDTVLDSTGAGDASLSTTCNSGSGSWAEIFDQGYYINNITLFTIGCGSPGAGRSYGIDIYINSTLVINDYIVNCEAGVQSSTGWHNVTFLVDVNYSETWGSLVNVSFVEPFNDYNGNLIGEMVVRGDTDRRDYNAIINSLEPINNTGNISATVDFTYNVSFASVESSCSIYTNMTGTWEANKSNESKVLNNSLNYFEDIVFSDGTYLWNVNCVNDSSWNEYNNTLIIDTVLPTMTTNFTNGTYLDASDNTEYVFNFSDETLLHSINISLNHDNSVIFNKTDIALTFYNYNFSYSPLGLEDGNYSFTVTYADGHTAKELLSSVDYNPSNGLFNDYIKYEFGGKYNRGHIKISQKDGSIFDSWSTEEELDRYSFKFEPSSKSDSYTFVIESGYSVYVVDAPDTKYGKWLIYDTHWLDFNPYKNFSVKKIDKNITEVTLYGINPKLDVIEFNSIGDLNVVNEDFYFMYNKSFVILTFNFLKNTGGLLNSVSTYFNNISLTATGNPLMITSNYWLNDTVLAINETLNITDLEGLYKRTQNTTVINISVSEYNFTLSPNQLILSFYDTNNNITNTSGYIADIDKQRFFNGSTTITGQNNLTEGRVNIRFNALPDGTNHTQYYEYINDGESDINENITILDNSDWTAYIRVLDIGNTPLSDVTVRASFSFHNQNTSFNDHKLFGQRLTDDDGYTFIVADSDSEVYLHVYKAGYEIKTLLLTIGDVSYTKDDPIIINLDTSFSSSSVEGFVMLSTAEYDNETEEIYGNVMYFGAEQIEVTTSYRESLGLSARDLTPTMTSYDSSTFILEEGTDFSANSPDNFNVTFYIDGGSLYWQQMTVTKVVSPSTDLFNIDNLGFEIEEGILTVILGIMLIVITALMYFVFRSQTIGFTVFMTGSILLSFISTAFLYLSIICVLYYMSIIIKKITSE